MECAQQGQCLADSYEDTPIPVVCSMNKTKPHSNRYHQLFHSDSRWAHLIRLSVGLIFFSEGIQKWMYPLELGVGRFMRIGIPAPDILAPLVGSIEASCGLLVLLGLCTRIAAVPLVLMMLGAVISVKVPIFLGQGWWLFEVRTLPRYGFWSVLHEARTDWAMLCGACYLTVAGGGRFALDRWLYLQKLHTRR